MKHFAWLVAIGVVAVAYLGSSSARPDPKTVDFVVIRVDKTTFEDTRLGKIRFETNPPFKATLVEGDAALQAVVTDMNGLTHVMSAGLTSSPPQRVVRTEQQFFRIMRYGWLKDRHQIRLRTPGSDPRVRSRFDAVAFADGKPDVALGAVAIDDMGYLQIVAGPAAQRARLGKIVDEANGRDGDSVDVPPPPGERRGSYSRGIARGTPMFLAMQRDRLYRDDVLLVPAGHARPDKTTIVGDRSWLAVHVPGGITVAPPSSDALVQLSGPPGGPLGASIKKYKGIAYTPAALAKYVETLHGSEPLFTASPPVEVEIAGRKLLAVAFQSRSPPARGAYVVVLWPQVHHLHDRDETTDHGIAISLVTSGSDAPPSAAKILADPSLAIAVDSLYVNFDRAP